MTTIGIIGSGHVGTNLAEAAVTHGYDVVISNSKGPQTLASLVAQLGPKARAAAAGDFAMPGGPRFQSSTVLTDQEASGTSGSA